MDQWYLVYTKPHEEPLVNRQLEDRGLEVFFPALQIDRGYRRGIRLEPFFPCYVFVKVDLASQVATGIPWLAGVRSIVHFGSQPAVTPEPLIHELRRRFAPYARQVVRKSEWLFQPGQRVVIKHGPLKGFEAIFQKGLDGRQRAQVLLELLGSATRAEVDLDQIESLV